MRYIGFAAATFGCLMAAGCNTVDPPLIFGKVDTFGAQVAATAPDQGANLTLGYRSAKVAIVPVYARDANGRVIKVLARVKGTQTQKNEKYDVDDAFSTFAHFEATAGAPATACLGDTFATGIAAQRISQNLASVCAKK